MLLWWRVRRWVMKEFCISNWDDLHDFAARFEPTETAEASRQYCVRCGREHRIFRTCDGVCSFWMNMGMKPIHIRVIGR